MQTLILTGMHCVLERSQLCLFLEPCRAAGDVAPILLLFVLCSATEHSLTGILLSSMLPVHMPLAILHTYLFITWSWSRLPLLHGLQASVQLSILVGVGLKEACDCRCCRSAQ